MKFIVGSDTGLAKVCEVERKTFQSKWGEAERGSAVDALCWADPSPSSDSSICETKVYVAVHRSIPLLESKEEENDDELRIKEEPVEESAENSEEEGDSMKEWEEEEGKEEEKVKPQLPYRPKMLVKSVVSLWDYDQDISNPHSIEIDGTVRGIHAIHANNSAVESSNSSDRKRKVFIGNDVGSFRLYESEGDKNSFSLLSEFDACPGHPVSRFRVNPFKSDSFQFAFGGVKNELQIFDFETKEKLFEAKNVKPDKLWRAVPVWVSDLGYVDENRIATSTGHHQVRLYDVQAQRRPIADFVVGKYPIMCMLVSKSGNSVYVADTTGTINEWDFRMTKSNVRGFVGNTGSVRGLALHPTIPAIISVGLDRFARVYSTKTSRLESKLYMKQKMNCVLWTSEPRRRMQTEVKEKKKKEALLKEDGELYSDGDDEDIWDIIPTVGGKKNSNKIKTESSDKVPSKKPIEVSDEDEDEEDMMEEEEDESEEHNEENDESDDSDDSDDDSSGDDKPPKKKGKKEAPPKKVSAKTMELKQKLKIAIARKKLEQSQRNKRK